MCPVDESKPSNAPKIESTVVVTNSHSTNNNSSTDQKPSAPSAVSDITTSQVLLRPTEMEEQQSSTNTVALLNLFYQSLVVDPSYAPVFTFNSPKPGERFECVVTAPMDENHMTSVTFSGAGPTKLIAKREASVPLLSTLFPSATSNSQVRDSLIALQAEKKRNKCNHKISSLLPSSANKSVVNENSDTDHDYKNKSIVAQLPNVASVSSDNYESQQVLISSRSFSNQITSFLNNFRSDKCNIRAATASDVSEIMRLIRELADFEKSLSSVKITEETLLQDGFNCDHQVRVDYFYYYYRLLFGQ